MTGSVRQSRIRESTTWPGFVDALAALLMVIIFVLMLFVVAQFYLTQALSGRDKDLIRLQDQINEIGELLSLEKIANTELQTNIEQLKFNLESSNAERDKLSSQVAQLIITGDQLRQELIRASGKEAELTGQLLRLQSKSADLEDNLKSANEIARLSKIELDKSILQLTNLRKELEAKTKENESSLKQIEDSEFQREKLKREIAEARRLLDKIIIKLSKEKFKLVSAKQLNASLKQEKKLSNQRLNAQIEALRKEIALLNQTLETKEQEAEEKDVRIVDLGKKLNRALASKVQELARFRSEFFGKLQEVLKNRKDIRIVGDRFVFQSEVLFAYGIAEIGGDGKKELMKLANTLNKITPKIPSNIDWILQVEGHTDHIPIYNAKFQSNWDLSSARAISVVQFLIKEGVKPSRLSAAGFGEFQPLDKRRDEISNRRNRRIEIKLTQR